MAEKRKFRIHPGVLGIIVSVLLIISRFFGNRDAIAVESLNTVLVIVTLLICVHLVRATSALRQPHVWNAWQTLALFLMPLIMLVITGIQLIMRPPVFMSSKIFSALLIFVSIPVFLCFYFTYVSRQFSDNRPLNVFSRILLGLGIAYTVLRLLNDVLLPLIADAGRQIHPLLLEVTDWNRRLSFMIYVLSLAGFILLCGEFRAEGKQKRDEAE